MNKEDAIAREWTGALSSAGFPPREAWAIATPISFCADWQGKNPDPQRETEVRLLWSRENLFLHFRARYRVMTVFADAEPNGRRDQLWERDVAEVFFQPDPAQVGRYKEFEVSPNGYWIDLDIAPEGKSNLRSGLKRSIRVDESKKIWTAELAISMKALAERFDPGAVWRVNFYRVEGPDEPRFYSAWHPTGTEQPNFHVPEAFGRLVFARAGDKK